MSTYLWLIAAVPIILAGGISYVLKVELPRARKLLQEIRTQQHTRPIKPLADAEAETHQQAEEEMEGNHTHTQEPIFDVTTHTIDIEAPTDPTGSTYFSERGVAEVLSLHGQSNKPNVPLFLIIPGNPGLVGFYRLFLLYLHRLCKGKVEFRCVSFVGHTSKSRNKGRVFSFDYQLKFFKRYLQQLIEQDPHRKIFLAGHSVGAYVCLQLLDSLTPQQAKQVVPQVFLLLPTVFDIASTPNGVIHTPVLNWCRPFIVGLIGLISLLPKSLKEYILYAHIGLHPFEVEAAQGVLQVETVRNCLFMAMHEMAQIGPVQIDLIRRHLPSLYWIWGQTDQWAPMSQLATLKETFGKELQYEVAVKEVAHAFVVGGAHLVAPMVHQRLKKFL